MGENSFRFLSVIGLNIVLIAILHAEVFQQFCQRTYEGRNKHRGSNPPLLRPPGSDERYNNTDHFQDEQYDQVFLEKKMLVHRLLSRLHLVADLIHDHGYIAMIEQGGRRNKDIENCQADINRRDRNTYRSSKSENREDAQSDGHQRGCKDKNHTEHIVDSLENADRTRPALSETEPDGGDCFQYGNHDKRHTKYEYKYDRSGRKPDIQRKGIDDLLYGLRGNLKRFQDLCHHGLPVTDCGSLLEDPV